MVPYPNLFPACYFPPVPWFSAAINQGKAYVDMDEPYRKQRLSSRTHIRVSNRVMPLTVPVQRRDSRALLRDKQISYAENWPHQHWQSLVSAYGGSPYFAYYAPGVHALYERRIPDLMTFLSESMVLSGSWLELEVEVCSSVEKEVGEKGDFRKSFDPARRQFPTWYSAKPYPQVFAGFESGLSILDLIFNLGPESRVYLLNTFKRSES